MTGLAVLTGCQGGFQQPGAGQSPVISDAPSAPPLKPGSSFVADAVAKVGPAVVRIDTRREVANPIGSIFGGGPPVQQQQGQGSGFITRSDGVLLTNAHVVEGAGTVTAVSYTHLTLPTIRWV